jgi:uncharacterized Fe-S cluster protein YjdI
MDKQIIKKYSNNDITIIWQPALCIHSAKCWHGVQGLPEVFNPQASPWVNINGADTNTIIAKIDQCPSGALSYINNTQTINNMDIQNNNTTLIEVAPNGPLLVTGTITVKKADGTTEVKETKCALCRCGASANKPYCDGAHKKIEFKD